MHEAVNGVAPNLLAPAFDAVVTARRSIYAYRRDDVPRAAIETALHHAAQAPNHHRTKPWRFFVVPLEARERLIDAYATAARRLERDVERARVRAADAPVNVVIACVPARGNPRVDEREEAFAVAAAAQNFMLSLAAAGIGSLLTTGALAESSEVAELIGFDPQLGQLMGVINVGYRNPDRPLPPRPEPDIAGMSRWIGPA